MLTGLSSHDIPWYCATDNCPPSFLSYKQYANMIMRFTGWTLETLVSYSMPVGQGPRVNLNVVTKRNILIPAKSSTSVTQAVTLLIQLPQLIS